MKKITAIVMLIAGLAPAAGQDIPVPDRRPSMQAPAGATPNTDASPNTAAGQAVVEVARPDRREHCAALRLGLVTGKQLQSIAEGDCGAASPVMITAVGSVALSGEVVLTCGMATTLAQFLPEAQKLARDVLGSDLAKIEGGNGYECRNRNRASSGKLSEHAFANAYDISAFWLADGRRISVAEGWPHLQSLPPAGEKPAAPQTRATTPQAHYLTGVHAASCALFSTVLGPDENAEHREHFHLDLGCHGKDCTYYICS